MSNVLKVFFITYISLHFNTSLWGSFSPDFSGNATYEASSSAVKSPVKISAHSLYADLVESSLTLKGAPLTPEGSGTTITYGAESEGSSARIVRAMGPYGEAFSTYVYSEENHEFLRQFMKDFISGKSRLNSVVDQYGNNKNLSQEQMNNLRDVNYDTASYMTVVKRFEKFIKYTQNKPFSYLKNHYRKKLFLGSAPNQSKAIRKKITYTKYVPHFGLPEKYTPEATYTSKGWEILFAPQPSYAEFEKMIDWYRTEFGSNTKLFKAPGHQRIVYPKPLDLPPGKRSKWNQHVNEILRHIQAYIVIRGLQGNTGIEKSKHKNVLVDKAINVIGETDRGVIRLDKPNRFIENHYGLELRAGTKDIEVRQFVEQVFASRVASRDFSGLRQANSWRLIDRHYHSVDSLTKRFGVNHTVALKFLRKRKYFVRTQYQIALWYWENAPYLQGKRQLLKQATRNYIEQVAAMSKNEVKTKGKLALRRWLKTVKLETSVHEYLRPERIVKKAESLQRFESTGRVNVNKIDLGIEYSGRFQGNYLVGQSPEATSDGTKAWLETRWDMTPYERKKAIKDMALDLAKRLNNGHRTGVIDVTSGEAHGHGQSIAFAFRDKNGGKWRVEWDGVGRNYTEDGKIIPESLRGGHIEIVTPKYVPNSADIRLLYGAMSAQNIIPSHKGGGGHINIDLAPFEGNPRALARFLTLFHEHRGIMSFMFTNISRTMVAEPIEISEELSRRLKNFNGSEAELKRLLYNERYFNQRVGRKTRNVQTDLTAYFQDVIPAEHIHSDFDVKNPTEPWRPQFRVEPHIRKMEFRMFDAPLDAFESSMQIKLIRSMLNQALNETSSLKGRAQEVNHQDYAENYDKAQRDLAKMCRAFGLSANDYKIFIARAAAQVKKAVSSRFYQTYEEKARARGWNEVPDRAWGDALERERVASEALSSSERQWQGEELPEAREFRLKRIAGAKEGTALRLNTPSSGAIRREIKLSVNCRSVFR